MPRGFDLPTRQVREAHGLIWYWYGESAPAAEIPWFPGSAGARSANQLRAARLSRLIPARDGEPRRHASCAVRSSSDYPRRGNSRRVQEAWLDDAVIRMKVSLHHERSGWMRPTYNFTYALRLPTLATIEVARGIQFVASATPIDHDHTWLWARYGQNYIPGWLGGRIVARLAAKFDLELVFTNQDMRMLASQQRNSSGDISSYRLFEADRAIALYFGLRKQAINESCSGLSSTKPRAAAAE